MILGRFTLATVTAGAIACAPAAAFPAPTGSGIAEPAESCRVVDGDTLRCGTERVRLLGIDAPELPGHCRAGRACVPGDPIASARSLGEALSGPIIIDRIGSDRYGRTIALVRGAKGDLSCWQLSRGKAIYKPKWDNGGRLAQICSAAR